MKSSPSIWRLLHTVKLTVKIVSIYVTFLEKMNFKEKLLQCKKFDRKLDKLDV